MTDRKPIYDISDLLFPGEEPSSEEVRQQELYFRASQEAFRLVGRSSPLNLLRKTEEIYNKYLEETR